MDWLYGKGKIVVNLLLAALMIALYLATSAPAAQSAMSDLYNSPVYRGHKKGVVAIECAVSWNAAALSDLLALLRERNLQITFLVSGEWAEQNPALLQEMAKGGHEIGTLGQDPARDGDEKTVEQDLAQSVKAIGTLSGVYPELYYSGARRLGASAEAARRLGLTHVLCTVDLLSGRGNAQDILLRALDKPFDGSILLIQPTAEAVKAMPACIDGLAKKGFRVVTVSATLGDNIQKEVKV